MAWASKKQMAILYQRGDKGKDILEKLPDMSADEFDREFTELIKGKGKPEEAKPKDEGPTSKGDNAKAKKAEDKTLGDAKTASVEDGKNGTGSAEAKSEGESKEAPKFEAKQSPDGKTYEDYAKSVKNPVSKDEFDSIMGFLSPEAK